MEAAPSARASWGVSFRARRQPRRRRSRPPLPRTCGAWAGTVHPRAPSPPGGCCGGDAPDTRGTRARDLSKTGPGASRPREIWTSTPTLCPTATRRSACVRLCLQQPPSRTADPHALRLASAKPPGAGGPYAAGRMSSPGERLLDGAPLGRPACGPWCGRVPLGIIIIITRRREEEEEEALSVDPHHCLVCTTLVTLNTQARVRAPHLRQQ